MSLLKYIWLNILMTLLRVMPFPCQTGLIKIGNPGREAPVLLTGNYRLTVARVKRAIKGLDAYLLVANSRGINVWCAATGGLLTNHDVISVLKTSEIEEHVDHRQLILPQLAATGIEGRVVRQRTGWQVVWGPVEADDVVQFVHEKMLKSPRMRTVCFPWMRRVEMAVAWAFPISLLTLFVMPWWNEGIVPLMSLVWCVSLLLFLSFPLYQDRLRGGEKQTGFVLLNFGPHAMLLLLWAGILLALASWTFLTGEFSIETISRWGLGSFIVLLILSLDLTGSTPLYKSGLHEDRLLHVELDEKLCEGVGLCESVCPVSVFKVDEARLLATLPGASRCVQCGACIVQCPCDALKFRSPSGTVVTPDSIRRFKLNLLGKRSIRAR